MKGFKNKYVALLVMLVGSQCVQAEGFMHESVGGAHAGRSFEDVDPHIVAVEGHKNEMEQLLKENPQAIYNRESQYGDTPLHTAVREGNFDTVDAILEHNTDAVRLENAQSVGSSDRGHTPLDLAVTLGDKDMASHIAGKIAAKSAELKKTPDYLGVTNVNRRRAFDLDDVNKNAFYVALASDKPEIAKGLVDSGASLGTPELTKAAAKGHKDLVDAMVRKGISLQDPVEYRAHSALGEAAYNGQTDMVKHLLSKHGDKVDVNYKGFGNKTALENAFDQGHLETVKALINPNFSEISGAQRALDANHNLKRLLEDKDFTKVLDYLAVENSKNESNVIPAEGNLSELLELYADNPTERFSEFFKDHIKNIKRYPTYQQDIIQFVKNNLQEMA